MRTESQNKQIYDWMKAGNSINPIQALKMFGCFRLGARCFDIERIYDVEIKREMQYEGDKRYMKYWV
jgi:hypothetical protein